jgi:NAD(P)-dependent dehydrogenase (short-subunit alcohol dehydrogenase family)
MPPTRGEFDATMHFNVLGAMQTIPQVAPLVEAAQQGQGGKFIFITSALGRIGGVESSFGWTYRVGKAAQHDYPRALMLPMHPGWERTDMGGPGRAAQPRAVGHQHAQDHCGLDGQRQRQVFRPR